MTTRSKLITTVFAIASMVPSMDAIAAPVSPENAASEAARLLSSIPTVRKVRGNAPAKLTLAYTSTADTLNCFYIFNIAEGGFAIVSADDRVPALLGFSTNGNFDPARTPDNMKWWLSEYTSQISGFLKRDPSLSDAAIRSARRGGAESERKEIKPMLTTTWDQTAPYNNDCPFDGSTGQRSVTGCVATAMAQIMKYHAWPVNPKGMHAGVNFTGTTLRWDQMLDSYASGNYNATQAAAVAQLMRQCGASVDMMYSSWASGAYSFDVPDALATYFDYNPSMELQYRDYYTQRAWNSMVYDELAAGRPVYYSGQSDEGGHAFVCDGYLSDEMYHFNWGWSGYQDGYFRLNALNPNAGGTGSYSGGYNAQQGIILGVRKSAGETRRQQMLLSTGNFTWNNTNEIFAVTEGAGQSLIYNPLAYSMTFNIGVKITSLSDPSNVVYARVQSSTTLQSLYGITEYSVPFPALSDGEYRVTPVFYDTYHEWQDVKVPYGRQSYVGLSVKNGKRTFTNYGGDAETHSELIASRPRYVSPLYEGDALAFEMTLSNVAQGDYYNNVSLGLYNEDPFGDVAEMQTQVSVPGNSSLNVMFTTPEVLSAGKYSFYCFNNEYKQLMEPISVEILPRTSSFVDSNRVRFDKISPSFQDVEEECGVSINAVNSTTSAVSQTIIVKLLKASDLSEVYSLSSAAPYVFPGGKSVTLNFNPQKLNIPAGGYFWKAVDEKGTDISRLQPVLFTGPRISKDGMTFEVTDEAARTARLVAVDPNAANVSVPEECNGYRITDLLPDIFTFNSVVEQVALPSGIGYIPDGLFYKADNLTGLAMMSQTPAELRELALPKEARERVWISGPGGYTNLYHADPLWAPFRFSSWNIKVGASVTADLLKDADGKVYAPYYVPSFTPTTFKATAPEGQHVRARFTIDGSQSELPFPYGVVELPALNGGEGSVELFAAEGSSVDGVEADSISVDVFNTTGILIGKGMTPEEIRQLPAGIYIAGGRKIIVW